MTLDFYKSGGADDDDDLTTMPKGKPNLGDDIETILEQESGQMHRKEILSRLVEKGIDVTGDPPIGNISGILSYDSRFVRGDERGYWKLAERQLEDTAE